MNELPALCRIGADPEADQGSIVGAHEANPEQIVRRGDTVSRQPEADDRDGEEAVLSTSGVQRVVESLRRSAPAQMLKKSALGEVAKLGMFSALSSREFVHGYRHGTQISSPTFESPAGSDTPASPLEEYFDGVTEGPGIWKWRHYFEIYHRHLERFRGQSVNVVEIGIYSGGSLQMWNEYFGAGCHVYGVDIQSACRVYDSENVTVFIGDQADPEFWREFVRAAPPIDVVIDDGGHRGYQQIATLKGLLPHMRAGGVFICEDIDGPMAPFLSFVDGLTRHLSSAERGAANPLQQQVASVHRYPLMTVIEKPGSRPNDFIDPHHGTKWQPFLGEVRPVDGGSTKPATE